MNISDQIFLCSGIPLNTKLSNIGIYGSYIIIETVNEYLVRVSLSERNIDSDIIILSPSGTFLLDNITTEIHTRTKGIYHFVGGVENGDFIQYISDTPVVFSDELFLYLNSVSSDGGGVSTEEPVDIYELTSNKENAIIDTSTSKYPTISLLKTGLDLKSPIDSPVFTTNITSPIIELSGSSDQIVFQSDGVTGTLTWTPTTISKTITFPDRTLTIDNITTSSTTNGTGFLKGDGSVVSFDNSIYEPTFSKNTGFNLNLGSITGTVLEGRTFGTAAAAATTDFAPSSVYTATGLSTGYLPYKTSTVLGNSSIYTNGTNVGIGTTAPGAKLDVRGTYTTLDGSLTAPIVNILSTNTAAVDIGGTLQFGGKTGNSVADWSFGALKGAKESAGANDYAGYLSFWTMNGVGAFNGDLSERMRIASNGNIGIGTISPTHFITAEKSSNSSSSAGFPTFKIKNTLATKGNGTSTWNDAEFKVSAGNDAVIGGIWAEYTDTLMGFQVGTADANPVNIVTSDLPRVTVLNSGNVGIGYVSGTEITDNRLAVNGSGYFATSVTASSFALFGATSGFASIVVPSVAGTPTLTLPITTGTIALTSDVPTATSGTYTPTATNVTNITSSTPNNATYTRVGNIVTVYGTIIITNTLAVASEVDITLPVVSNLVTATDLNGTGTMDSTASVNLYIKGNIGNDRASIYFTSVGVGQTSTIYFTFQYSVL